MSIASEITRLQTAKADLKTAIIAKGVEVADTDTIDTYASKVEAIESGGEKALFTTDGRMYAEHIEFPETVTTITEKAFKGITELRSVVIPNSVTSIGASAFQECVNLTQINLPENVETIGSFAFYYVGNVTTAWNIKTTMTTVSSLPNVFSGGKLIYEEGITTLPTSDVFNYGGCTFSNGAYVYLPSTVENANVFNHSSGTSGLKTRDDTCTLEVGEGFNVAINASQFQQTADKWVNVFNALADRTGQDALTLAIGKSNLAKLTAEQIAIATNKNWTLA